MSGSKLLSVALGANICRNDGTFDYAATKSIAVQLSKLVLENYKIAAIVGAGGAARTHLSIASKYAKKEDIDRIAIKASRINSMLLIAALRELGVSTNASPLVKMEQVEELLSSKSGCVAVLGGLKTGMTSDSTAASIAKKMNCPLIIVSTKGAIFERDPELQSSKALDTVDRTYLQAIVKSRLQNHVLDSQTCRILLSLPRGKKILIVVTGHRNITRVAQTISSKSIKGCTRIVL